MLFVDSSVPSEVKRIFSWGVASGVTTNPLIISREHGDVDLEACIREILACSHGPVAVELTSETYDEMLREALGYHEWDPERVHIKIPFGELGLQVLRQLRQRHVRTNVTCMLSFNQVYLAALGGADYLSIFGGRVRDLGCDVRPLIAECRAVLEREGLPGKLLVGSMRQMYDVNEAIQAGAHVVTVPAALFEKMLHHPRTESTIREFQEAWVGRTKR